LIQASTMATGCNTTDTTNSKIPFMTTPLFLVFAPNYTE